MLPPKRSSAGRLLPCLHYIVLQLQTVGNSRGQRTVDPILMYRNYGSQTNRILNFEDKQIVFPEDDDSDIIIVNEDYTKESYKDDDSNLKDNLVEIEPTTEMRATTASDITEYAWKTTDWSPCNAVCGQIGHQVRGAMCQHKRVNQTTTVETEECLSRGLIPPKVVLECGGDNCANWRTSQWSSRRCLRSGTAIIRRRVDCTADNGTVLPQSSCDFTTKPEKIRKDGKPCTATWDVGPWTKCKGECGGSGRQHRTLRCVWRAGGGTGVRGTPGERGARGAGVACRDLRRPAVLRDCPIQNCVSNDGACRDTSRFCENVRAMNMCALKRYKEQCCKTCSD